MKMKLSENPMPIRGLLTAVRCDEEKLDVHDETGVMEIYKCKNCNGVHVVMHSDKGLSATVLDDDQAMTLVEMLHKAVGVQRTVQ